MLKAVRRLVKALLLVLVNLVIIAVLLAGFEIYLRLTDPFLRLPFDTSYYKTYKSYYPELTVPPSILEDHLTWGHLVTNNFFGFREEEIDRPKPVDLCRIVVLGDSFTWGAGLDIDERYPDLVEEALGEAFPDKKIEVLSWARSGWSTVLQRDALRDFKAWLNPDYIIVAFVLNDPQVEEQGSSPEKSQFYAEYGSAINTGLGWLIRLGLSRTAKTLYIALDNFMERSGVFPDWETAVQRTYEPAGPEWQAFTQALQDIKAMSDTLKLPAPLFIVLNQDIFWDQPTEVTSLDPSLPIYLRWYHQAEQTAAKAGFRSYNHEKELLEQLNRAEIPLNELDAHPSARVNQLYAEKLFTTLAGEIREGRLCPLGAGRGVVAATGAPLAEERLLSVRFGPHIRFLGYTAGLVENQPLRLTLGWQALEEINTSYTVVLELVDSTGKVWFQQKSLPCQGDCLTVFWPAGLIAPPGSEIVYWPEDSKLLPFTLEALPYQGELRDRHELRLPAELPAGDYRLLMGLYDAETGEFLPALDEISYASPLENRVVLGKIVLPK